MFRVSWPSGLYVSFFERAGRGTKVFSPCGRMPYSEHLSGAPESCRTKFLIKYMNSLTAETFQDALEVERSTFRSERLWSVLVSDVVFVIHVSQT